MKKVIMFIKDLIDYYKFYIGFYVVLSFMMIIYWAFDRDFSLLPALVLTILSPLVIHVLTLLGEFIEEKINQITRGRVVRFKTRGVVFFNENILEVDIRGEYLEEEDVFNVFYYTITPFIEEAEFDEREVLREVGVSLIALDFKTGTIKNNFKVDVKEVQIYTNR